MDITKATGFSIFGQEIIIMENPDLDAEEGAVGLASDKNNWIIIQPITKEFEYAKDACEETYWHEIVHQILDKIEYKKLSNDERLVSLFGKALHQVIKTLKFRDE